MCVCVGEQGGSLQSAYLRSNKNQQNVSGSTCCGVFPCFHGAWGGGCFVTEPQQGSKRVLVSSCTRARCLLPALSHVWPLHVGLVGRRFLGAFLYCAGASVKWTPGCECVPPVMHLCPVHPSLPGLDSRTSLAGLPTALGAAQTHHQCCILGSLAVSGPTTPPR